MVGLWHLYKRFSLHHLERPWFDPKSTIHIQKNVPRGLVKLIDDFLTCACKQSVSYKTVPGLGPHIFVFLDLGSSSMRDECNKGRWNEIPNTIVTCYRFNLWDWKDLAWSFRCRHQRRKGRLIVSSADCLQNKSISCGRKPNVWFIASRPGKAQVLEGWIVTAPFNSTIKIHFFLRILMPIEPINQEWDH